MWSVLRRYQGISPADQQQQQQHYAADDGPGSASVAPVSFSDKDKAFRHNQRIIALHEWREHQVDPAPAINSVPYDRYCFEKALRLAAPEAALNAAPGGDNSASVTVDMRRGALGALIQKVFEKPQNVHHLMKEPSLVTSLIVTAAHPDEEVRKATCVLVRLIAQDRKGAEFLFAARKDERAADEHVTAIALSKKNAFTVSSAALKAAAASLDELTQLAPVRRRLADVGEVVRWVLFLCMDSSFAVATEALKAMATFHGFADSPEYTFALMRAQCVPCYAELVKSFRYESSYAAGEDAAAAAQLLASQRALTCAAALQCLRLITNAKEAFLDVLKADVLSASLKVVTDFDCSSNSAALASPSLAKLLCAAFSVAGELVLYTAGSSAAARRQKTKLPTLLPCARIAREHPDAAVRRDAAGALATLCVAEAGKAAALDEHGVVGLVRQLVHQEEDRDVVSSGCRIVCLLSELPAARHQLVDLADRLNEIASIAAEAKDAALEEGAARAARLVVWVPGQ
jgi:hypothetical protein